MTFDTSNHAVVSILFYWAMNVQNADTAFTQNKTSTRVMKHYVYVHFLPLNSLLFIGFFFCFIGQTYYTFMIDTIHHHIFLLLVSETLSHCILWSCREFLYDRGAEIELHISIRQAVTEDTQVIYWSHVELLYISWEKSRACMQDSLKQNKGK